MRVLVIVALNRVYNFGSSRVRYSTFVSSPPEIDTPDTPDLSVLRCDDNCYII